MSLEGSDHSDFRERSTRLSAISIAMLGKSLDDFVIRSLFYSRCP